MNKAVELDFKKKINFCIDAAKGLNYLHSLTPPVIHRDLKTANLLVDKFWRVKVADFGLSRVVDTQDTMTHCGTLDFCAPEILIRARYTIKADIYSFAVCIWQIFTRRKPYPNVPLYQMAKDVVQSNVRPNLSYIKIASLRNLIERGWTVVPQDRPSMEEILHQLKAIKKDYSQKQKTRELGAQPPPNLSIN